MNMNYFSPSENAFYVNELKESYIAAGTWPLDVIEVDESLYLTFIDPPLGKYRGVNEEGMPCWLDIPPPSMEEQQHKIEAQKQYLIRIANEHIAYLQDAVDLDMATDNEVTSLKEWKKYRVLLNRLDVSDVDVVFPEQPSAIL